MKKLIHSILLITIASLSLFVLTSCKKSSSSASGEKEKALVTNESTSEPEENSDETTEETADNTTANPEETKDDANTTNTNTNTSASKQVATTAPTKKATTNTTNSSSNVSVVFDDFLNPQEYKVTKTGNYTISCNPSDNKASWDIYVLDEQFDDALRYLTSAYTPAAKAEAKARTINLKQGQYLYAICSENSLTFEGDKSTFKCPLTIALK